MTCLTRRLIVGTRKICTMYAAEKLYCDGWCSVVKEFVTPKHLVALKKTLYDSATAVVRAEKG